MIESRTPLDRQRRSCAISAPSTPVTHGVVAALSVGLLALGACSSDGDSSTDGGDGVSTEELSARGSAPWPNRTAPVSFAELQGLAASAPDDVTDDMNAFADLFTEMTALSEEATDEAQVKLTEKLADYEELTARLDTWSNENCPDLPENVFTAN